MVLIKSMNYSGSLIVMFSVILNNTVLYYNAYFLCYISVVF